MNGELQLKTLPGESPVRYTLEKALTIQHLRLDVDFRVLRAARVFIKEVSSGQYTNEGHTTVEKPAFLYHPSVITNFPEEAGKGRFVHLVSVGLQLAQVTWMSTKQLPFYVRGLLRAVPTGLLPEVFAIATITDPDMEVLVDHHLLLWARVKNGMTTDPSLVEHS